MKDQWQLSNREKSLTEVGDCPFLFTNLYTFRMPFRDWKGAVSVGCCCNCFPHCDFGLPGLSFGRLISPPAALCVLRVLVEWLAGLACLHDFSVAPDPGSGPPKAAGAAAPRTPPSFAAFRKAPLARMPRDGAKSLPQICFCSVGCFVLV